MIIGADDMYKICMWIDATYAINSDMKIQTGGVMSIGTGALYRKFIKQKLYVKRSTEVELVGVSEYIPYNF